MNSKHRQQWGTTLATYASPIMGSLPVAAIDTALVMKVLEPIWRTKTETASRLRGRIERVLAWATTRGFRQGENPARWRGHLDNLLSAPTKTRKVRHHAALPVDDVPAFMVALRSQGGVAAAALEFTILTATRTGEALGATWDEIDFRKAVWTIPASRMKVAKAHRVPLVGRALEILQEMQAAKFGEHVFPGQRHGKSLSSMSMLMLLRRMDRAAYTTHGFRCGATIKVRGQRQSG